MPRNIACIILFMLLTNVRAQPGNTSCASAALVCAQQPVAGNNTGAAGAIPDFCPPMGNVLWYTFTTNSQGGEVQVSVGGIDCPVVAGLGNELVAVVLSADDCDGPFTEASSCASGSQQFSLVTAALQPATTYWLLIAGEQGVSGAAQCEFTVQVSGPGADVLGVDIIVSDDVEIGIGESTQLNVEGGSGHTWSPTTGLSNANAPDPIASPSSTTIYTVTTQLGPCTYTDQVKVEVIRRIIPPNTFTPNGDGVNDTWEIPGMNDYPGAEILIFDRWGQRVYASTGYREPWDGTFNGARLPDATYYYHIQLNQLEGRSPPYTGFISIIR